MLLLHSIEPSHGTALRIPFYLRAPLSLKDKSTVSLAYLSVNEAQLPEIAISPVAYDDWRHCYRISAAFHDRPGVVNELLDVLAEYHINVLIHESGSSVTRGLHEIELIVSISGVHQDHKDAHDWETRFIPELEQKLRCAFVDSLEFAPFSQHPHLSIRQMKGLIESHERSQESQNRGHHPVAIKRVEEDDAQSSAKKVHYELDMADLKDRLGLEGYLEQVGDDLVARYTMICDTKDRLMRAVFFRQDDVVVYVRVTHANRPGALAGITHQIKQEFTIIHCLTRSGSKQRNQFEAIVMHTGDRTRQVAVDYAKARLKELENIPALKGLGIKVGFPRSAGSQHKADAQDEQGPGILPPYDYKSTLKLMRPSTLSILEEKRLRLVDRITEMEISGERDTKQREYSSNGSRLHFLNDLQKQLEKKRPILRSVFTSYGFEDQKLQMILEAVCTNASLKLVTGRMATLSPMLWKTIQKLVSESDALISVWSPADDQDRMREWIFWELGCADAAGKDTFVLYDDRIVLKDGAYLNFLAGRPNLRFNHLDESGERCFKSVLERAIIELRNRKH